MPMQLAASTPVEGSIVMVIFGMVSFYTAIGRSRPPFRKDRGVNYLAANSLLAARSAARTPPKH